jgi:predicted aldo/keto reductase-like oxidoreductase
MRFRKLGRTGLKVSTLGLGTEFLHRRTRKTVIDVIHKAIDNGVNYFDIVFAFPEYRDYLGAAFKGYRDKTIVCGHICCAETKGHYRLSRDVKENEKLFNDLLKRLNVDYVDIVMIQMVNEVISYENIMKSGGIMELAQKIKRHGKARFIGISGHKTVATSNTLKTGLVDMLMFPINIAWDFVPGRKEILKVCAKDNIGLVAMKPYAGGRIFAKPILPAQAINYCLSQKPVATVVPGVKSIKELDETLKFLSADKQEKDFRPILKDCQEELRGNCVYCNHCLPCPQRIDIGNVLNRIDRAMKQVSEKVNFYYPGRLRLSREHYKGLLTKASKCNECGICIKRCPFEVDIIAKMRQARRLLK